ncbi:helix-turn-helix domain-containing protein [Sinorhizobium sp. NFACC03]|uniref:helix-turn-helix domain-containing protein n=1 Tax=Sinorhizobium sp. NFACC03 TaxID=1566295 RepID=UPI00088C8FFA|nr:Helix-turn-helix domain-containing protein [Sinorhizobium sp. NFACC03]
MEQHTENTISISELAASVGLSRRQLERLFMEKAKMSPALVYRKLRLERAKHLLTQTDASLIEIALEVGFESAGHFSRIFAKTYGQTPSRLRAQRST